MRLVEQILALNFASRKKNGLWELPVHMLGLQDATAGTILLQAEQLSNIKFGGKGAIFCDHLMKLGHEDAISQAEEEHAELYQFLELSAEALGFDFYPPGTGIIHTLLIEKYAEPGMILVGSDSHTPTAGSLGCLSLGSGGPGIVELLAKGTFDFQDPGSVLVQLNGPRGVNFDAKALVFEMMELLKGKLDHRIIEYWDQDSLLEPHEKMILCNAAAEMGARTAVFAPSKKLQQAWRVKREWNPQWEQLKIFPDKAFYSEHLEFSLADKKSVVFKTDQKRSELDLEEKYDFVIIGSCTHAWSSEMNALLSDLKSKWLQGSSFRVPVFYQPGSLSQAERLKESGFQKIFTALGGRFLESGCGGCAGQWRHMNTTRPINVLTSFNRNYSGRFDGNSETKVTLASPKSCLEYALADSLEESEIPFDFGQRSQEKGRSKNGFKNVREFLSKGESLKSLPRFKEQELSFNELPVLAVCDGVVSTDHLAPIGKWLPLRNHLEKFAPSLMIGIKDLEEKQIGRVETSFAEGTFFEVAREAQMRFGGSCLVAGENFGEGSSREHAALNPRYMGIKLILAKSFFPLYQESMHRHGILGLILPKQLELDDFLGHPFLDLEYLGKKNFRLRLKGEEFEIQSNFPEKYYRWVSAGNYLNTIS